MVVCGGAASYQGRALRAWGRARRRASWASAGRGASATSGCQASSHLSALRSLTCAATDRPPAFPPSPTCGDHAPGLTCPGRCASCACRGVPWSSSHGTSPLGPVLKERINSESQQAKSQAKSPQGQGIRERGREYEDAFACGLVEIDLLRHALGEESQRREGHVAPSVHALHYHTRVSTSAIDNYAQQCEKPKVSTE